jgi:hypothetical protein
VVVNFHVPKPQLPYTIESKEEATLTKILYSQYLAIITISKISILWNIELIIGSPNKSRNDLTRKMKKKKQ